MSVPRSRRRLGACYRPGGVLWKIKYREGCCNLTSLSRIRVRTMQEEPLRLIEDYLPLDIISERAAREKSQRSGNLASLHTWWGRKPQIAARAAVYTALVPAPHDNVQREAY